MSFKNNKKRTVPHKFSEQFVKLKGRERWIASHVAAALSVSHRTWPTSSDKLTSVNNTHLLFDVLFTSNCLLLCHSPIEIKCKDVTTK